MAPELFQYPARSLPFWGVSGLTQLAVAVRAFSVTPSEADFFSASTFSWASCGSKQRRHRASYVPDAPTTISSSEDRKSTRLNSSHLGISYAVFCLKKKKKKEKSRHMSTPQVN